MLRISHQDVRENVDIKLRPKCGGNWETKIDALSGQKLETKMNQVAMGMGEGKHTQQCIFELNLVCKQMSSGNQNLPWG